MRIYALLFCILLLVGCSYDFPQAPGGLGLAGSFYESLNEWASEPVTFNVAQNRVICESDKNVTLSFSITDRYIYYLFYIWHESKSEWVGFRFDTTELNEVWLRNNASFSLQIPCSEAQEFIADEEDEIYAAAYSCRKVTLGWNCNDNKWQVQVVRLVPPMPTELGDFDDFRDNSEFEEDALEEYMFENFDDSIDDTELEEDAFENIDDSMDDNELEEDAFENIDDSMDNNGIEEDGFENVDDSSDSFASLIAWNTTIPVVDGKYFLPLWSDNGKYYYSAHDNFTASVWCGLMNYGYGTNYTIGISVSSQPVQIVPQVAVLVNATDNDSFYAMNGPTVDYYKCQ